MISPFQTFKLNFDGACKPNPGEMTSAYIIKTTDEKLVVSETIRGGYGTSNVAEYMALKHGLEKAIELGIKHIKIYGDSKLVVKQIKGTNKANSKLAPYRDKIRELLKNFYTYKLKHVRREFNTEADELCQKGELHGSKIL